MVVKKICRIFLLIVLINICYTSDPESEEWLVDLGENITLPCNENIGGAQPTEFKSVLWIKSGKEERQISRLKILSDGSLSLERVVKSDSGEYLCRFEKDRSETDEINGGELVDDDDDIKTRYRLVVRTPPVLANVSVHPSTVLALLLWDVSDTGGYDISYFCAQYRLKYDPTDFWHNILPVHISPTARQIDVYHLSPNSTYTFRIWAVNALGDGEITEIDGTTNHIPEEIELARHLLEGAENFDTRIWVIAVAVVLGTLILLSAGTCYILCKEYNYSPFSSDDQEIIELVPNIILNPVFYDGEYHSDGLYRLDENFNNPNPIRINNSIGQPVSL